MIEYLAANPWLSVAANVLGIAGFRAGFVLYFRAKERFILTYEVAEWTLIHSSTTRPFDMDIPLNWDGLAIIQFTRSFILVRNTGNKLIERSDLVSQPSVRLNETSSILEGTVIFSDDPGSRAEFMPRSSADSTRDLSLEFLRPGDALVLKVDHTGLTNEVFIDCRTKAGGPIKKVRPVLKVLMIMVSLFGGCLVCGCIVVLVAAPPAIFRNHVDPVEFFFVSALLGVLMLAVAMVSILIGYLLFKSFYKKNIRTKRASEVWNDILIDKRRVGG